MSNFNLDIQFIDASNWQPSEWYSTGGSRAKKLLQDSEGKEYYFKCSEKKPAKDGKPEKHYKFEFWNEIIAYQLGKNLGLDILRYDVAIYDGEIGCISHKMTISDEEQLLDIGRFMTAINPNFLPKDNSTRKEYTFQLLEQTIDIFDVHDFWHYFFQTLLFDTIISNTDRHQENWAFIGNTTFIQKAFELIEKKVENKLFKNFKTIKKFINWIWDKFNLNVESASNTIGQQIIFESWSIEKYAPIFDSGSSMARELTEARVELLLSNEAELNKYIDNGKAELHWNNQKISHYNLIEELLNSSYLEQVKEASVFMQNWHTDLVSSILAVVDKDVPNQFSQYRIPENRKQLISKLLTLRFQKLNDLLNNARI